MTYSCNGRDGTKMQFRVGLGEVPKELEKGMNGMKVGGKRKITATVRESGSRLVLANTDNSAQVLFEVEILSIK